MLPNFCQLFFAFFYIFFLFLLNYFVYLGVTGAGCPLMKFRQQGGCQKASMDGFTAASARDTRFLLQTIG